MDEFIGRYHLWLVNGKVYYSVNIVSWFQVVPTALIFLVSDNGTRYNLQHIVEMNKVEDQ